MDKDTVTCPMTYCQKDFHFLNGPMVSKDLQEKKS